MWHTIFVQPLYNLLIILTNSLWGSLALGVIALTVLIKLVLLPLTAKSIKAQVMQQKLRPKMQEIQKNITDKTEQSKAIMQMYKDNNASPFSGCLPLLIQLPIIYALFTALRAGAMNDSSMLYHAVHLPEHFITWMGGIDLYVTKSWELAALCGLTQYMQLDQMPMAASDENDPTASMQKSLKYVLPIMITVFAYAMPGAVALYWVVSNVVTLVTEKVIRKRYK